MAKHYLKIAAIVAAATVGDGVFALPFIFYTAGWLTCLIYIVVLGAIIVMAHSLYLSTLEKVGEKERLLGLAKKYFGGGGFWTAFIAVVVGLLLTLVAYLILGSEFIHLALPMVRERYAFAVFWALISIPVFLSERYLVDLELVGIIATSAIILLIFFTALPNVFFASAPIINWQNFFLPFGAVLFSLAGWTSIEPAYDAKKKIRGAFVPWKALAAGTFFAAALYAMFAAGILGSTGIITPDTASDLAQWAMWKREILAIMGLVAVGTVYMPISREIRNALEKDLHWNKIVSRAVILLVPPALIVLGFNNFLVVVGIVGGVFLATQYILIILVGRRALALSLGQKIWADIAVVAFIAAAVYSIYAFIVR
jgi:amino acid permease